VTIHDQNKDIARIAKLQEEKNEAEETIAKLRQEKNEAEETIAKLRQEKNQTEERIGKLQEKKGRAGNIIDNLREEKERAEETNEALRQENETLRQENNQAKEEIETLRQKENQAKETNEALRQEKNQAEEEIETLRNQVQDCDKQIEEIVTKAKTMRVVSKLVMGILKLYQNDLVRAQMNVVFGNWKNDYRKTMFATKFAIARGELATRVFKNRVKVQQEIQQVKWGCLLDRFRDRLWTKNILTLHRQVSSELVQVSSELESLKETIMNDLYGHISSMNAMEAKNKATLKITKIISPINQKKYNTSRAICTWRLNMKENKLNAYQKELNAYQEVLDEQVFQRNSISEDFETMKEEKKKLKENITALQTEAKEVIEDLIENNKDLNHENVDLTQQLATQDMRNYTQNLDRVKY
jgi:SMC interacting uncharacterized protein involved in chromosome segregation